MHGCYPIFFSVTVKVTKTIISTQAHTARTKFTVGTHRLDNCYQSFLETDRLHGLMCPGLAEPNSRLARDSADQFLKFCDDTPSVATPPHRIIHRMKIRTYLCSRDMQVLCFFRQNLKTVDISHAFLPLTFATKLSPSKTVLCFGPAFSMKICTC